MYKPTYNFQLNSVFYKNTLMHGVYGEGAFTALALQRVITAC